MKTKLVKLFKSRVTQGGLLLGVIAAAAATIAWSSSPGVAIKLGGAWIGQSDNGVRSMATSAPSDPSGMRATLRVEMVWPPGFLASFGCDATTDAVGEEVVTGPNTSKMTFMWYGLAAGTIVLINLDYVDVTYTSPTDAILQHTVELYLAAADADNDGYPDPGSTPVATVSSTTLSKRVGH